MLNVALDRLHPPRANLLKRRVYNLARNIRGQDAVHKTLTPSR